MIAEGKVISSVYLVVLGFVLISPIQKSVNTQEDLKANFKHFDFSELESIKDSVNRCYDSIVFSNIEEKIKTKKELLTTKKELKEVKKENLMLKDSLEVLASDTIIIEKKKRTLIDKIFHK